MSQKIRELKVEELDTPIVHKLINDTQEEEQEIFKELGIAKSHNDLLLGYCSEAEKIALAEVKDAKERDLTDRTFRGKTYTTVVQAEKAKQLWSAFVAVYEWIEPNSSVEEIESSLSKMSKLEKQAPKKLLDEIRERIRKVKQNRDEVNAAKRTFLDITFNTKEERIEAEKQCQMLREEFQTALDDNSINSL